MNRNWLVAGALLGALAVILGAFAAHSLKSVFPPESLTLWETGVRYQFYHVFAIFIAVSLRPQFPGNSFIRWAAPLFTIGIILFSGSLYALAAMKANANSGLGAIGMLTPIGGLFFIAGWLSILIGVWKRGSNG
jgi:uncharacterized membrane protein YgdD (TMEM256/DUF423 family)